MIKNVINTEIGRDKQDRKTGLKFAGGEANHMTFTGVSGTGKTEIAKVLATKLACSDCTAVLFDDYGSFSGLGNRDLDSIKDRLHKVDVFSGELCFDWMSHIDVKNPAKSAKVIGDIFRVGKPLSDDEWDVIISAIEICLDNCDSNKFPNLSQHGLEGVGWIIKNKLIGKAADRVYKKYYVVFEHIKFKSGPDCLQQGKVNQLSFSDQSEGDISLAQNMILRLIWLKAKKEGYIHTDLFLFLDEIHKLEISRKNNILLDLVKMGRKFHVNLCLINQEYVSNANDPLGAVFSNIDSHIFFRPGDGEKELLAIVKILRSGYQNKWVVTLKDLDVGQFVITSKQLIVDGVDISYPIVVNGYKFTDFLATM